MLCWLLSHITEQDLLLSKNNNIFITVSFLFIQIQARKQKALFFSGLLPEHSFTQKLKTCYNYIAIGYRKISKGEQEKG